MRIFCLSYKASWTTPIMTAAPGANLIAPGPSSSPYCGYLRTAGFKVVGYHFWQILIALPGAWCFPNHV